MNPYSLLSKLYGVNSLQATLTTSSGFVYLLQVEPEENEDEALASNYSGAVNVRSWSCSIEALTDSNGIPHYPGEGDVLRVTGRDGNLLAFRLARESTSSRFWRWRWDRPGGRIVFYTARKELPQQ